MRSSLFFRLTMLPTYVGSRASPSRQLRRVRRYLAYILLFEVGMLGNELLRCLSNAERLPSPNCSVNRVM